MGPADQIHTDVSSERDRALERMGWARNGFFIGAESSKEVL